MPLPLGFIVFRRWDDPHVGVWKIMNIFSHHRSITDLTIHYRYVSDLKPGCLCWFYYEGDKKIHLIISVKRIHDERPPRRIPIYNLTLLCECTFREVSFTEQDISDHFIMSVS